MENHLAVTISVYIFILFASTGFIETYVPCNRSTFDQHVNNYCIPAYNQSMASTNYRDKCPWPSTRRSYVELNLCVDDVVLLSGCVEPRVKDAVFLRIHEAYFNLCSFIQDPDFHTLVALILPCIIATLILPFMCIRFATCT